MAFWRFRAGLDGFPLNALASVSEIFTPLGDFFFYNLWMPRHFHNFQPRAPVIFGQAPSKPHLPHLDEALWSLKPKSISTL